MVASTRPELPMAWGHRDLRQEPYQEDKPSPHRIADIRPDLHRDNKASVQEEQRQQRSTG